MVLHSWGQILIQCCTQACARLKGGIGARCIDGIGAGGRVRPLCFPCYPAIALLATDVLFIDNYLKGGTHCAAKIKLLCAFDDSPKVYQTA